MNDRHKVMLLADPVLLVVLAEGLAKETAVDICFTASRPEEASFFIDAQRGDTSDLIVVMDVERPLNIQPFLQTVNQKKIPLIAIVSSVNEGFALMGQGASDMLVRRAGETESCPHFIHMLTVHIKDAAYKTIMDRQRATIHAEGQVSGKIIAIGSSTGGTETVLHILKQMPPHAPPILVVQHMPAVFTKLYAERANTLCAINVWEARHGDRLANGTALIAPGDYHMTLYKDNGHFCVSCQGGELVRGQRPSADVLFESVAEVAKANAVGIILTGMGSDGADGLLAMRRQGAYTIGQDQATSVVYGMPRVAFEIGAVAAQLPLEKIAGAILSHALG